jgi:hypothetical protein
MDIAYAQTGANYYCPASEDSCVLALGTIAGYGAVGCCNNQNCEVVTTCVHAIIAVSICDYGCRLDTMTLKW